MTRDAQQAEITEDLQCFTREFFQIAVHHVELLKGPVHAEETVLLDQLQWRVDKFQYSHVQWIQSGIFLKITRPFLRDPSLCSLSMSRRARWSRLKVIYEGSFNLRSDLKNEREEHRKRYTNVSPCIFRTFCMWFLDEAAVKTESRLGGKEKGSLRSARISNQSPWGNYFQSFSVVGLDLSVKSSNTFILLHTSHSILCDVLTSLQHRFTCQGHVVPASLLHHATFITSSFNLNLFGIFNEYFLFWILSSFVAEWSRSPPPIPSFCRALDPRRHRRHRETHYALVCCG
ncbi:hypothetical protein X777_10774 [Ooceraea biroi]|uniref:Uncharacterized protein n=1 Tax=Ooceraea biroi TaxID=2015173 RepID=A0A026W6R8_OOCBI|nr:hypothetical protein X777_10774 [Ooceraea biroi]